MRRAGVEPAVPEAGGLQPLGLANAQPTHLVPVAQVGFEPTASLVLSQGGLPVAYRAVLSISAQRRIRTCNHPGLSRIALPVGVPGRFVGHL